MAEAYFGITIDINEFYRRYSGPHLILFNEINIPVSGFEQGLSAFLHPAGIVVLGERVSDMNKIPEREIKQKLKRAGISEKPSLCYYSRESLEQERYNLRASIFSQIFGVE